MASSTLRISSLRAATAAISEISKKERSFSVAGTVVVMRRLSVEEDLSAQREARQVFNQEDEAADRVDRVVFMQFIELLRLNTLAFAIVQIGDTDLRGVKYVELEEEVSPGLPKKVKKAEAVKGIVEEWSLEVKQGLLELYGKLVSEMEEEADKRILLENVDIDSEINRLKKKAEALQKEIASWVERKEKIKAAAEGRVAHSDLVSAMISPPRGLEDPQEAAPEPQEAAPAVPPAIPVAVVPAVDPLYGYSFALTTPKPARGFDFVTLGGQTTASVDVGLVDVPLGATLDLETLSGLQFWNGRGEPAFAAVKAGVEINLRAAGANLRVGAKTDQLPGQAPGSVRHSLEVAVSDGLPVSRRITATIGVGGVGESFAKPGAPAGVYAFTGLWSVRNAAGIRDSVPVTLVFAAGGASRQARDAAVAAFSMPDKRPVAIVAVATQLVSPDGPGQQFL